MNEHAKHPPGAGISFHRRLWVKLLSAYLVPVFFVFALVGYLVYRLTWITLENQLGESLIAVARTAARLVGKPRALRLESDDENSRTYLNLMSKLRQIQQAAGVELVYLFDHRERALVDSQKRFAIGERIVKLSADRAELQEVFNGRARTSVLFAGVDGVLYKSGFAPVKLEGEIRAAVGVDGSARFLKPLSYLGNVVVMVSLIGLVLVVGLSLLVSRLITRPLARLTESAGIIGSGRLDRNVRIETRDEIGVLAHTLEEMRKSIQTRDQTLQMMLAGIAHEVRNPLGGITLFLGLLKREISGNLAALSHLQRVENELGYLTRVVNDFLDYARKRPLSLEQLDPRDEIEQIKLLTESECCQKNIQLDVEVAPDIKTVEWDRDRMRRVLHNLVRNAVQASSQGGRVVINLQVDSAWLSLTVQDKGCGIPREQHEKVFEPFFTTRQQGTGLGLSLAKQTVESHGGTIRLDSSPESGTIITLRLPS